MVPKEHVASSATSEISVQCRSCCHLFNYLYPSLRDRNTWRVPIFQLICNVFLDNGPLVVFGTKLQSVLRVRLDLNCKVLVNTLKYSRSICKICLQQVGIFLVKLLGTNFEIMQSCKNRTLLFIGTKRRDARSGPQKTGLPWPKQDVWSPYPNPNATVLVTLPK